MNDRQLAACRVTVNGDSFPGRSPDTVWLTGLRQGAMRCNWKRFSDSLATPSNLLTTAWSKEVTLAARKATTAGFQGTSRPLSSIRCPLAGRCSRDRWAPTQPAWPLPPTGESPGANRCPDAAEPDPANSYSAEEPPPNQTNTFEPVTERAIQHPSGRIRETSAKRCRRPFPTKLSSRPRGWQRLDRPDTSLS